MFSGYLGRAEASGGSRETGAFHCHSQYTGGQYQLEISISWRCMVSVGVRYSSEVISVGGRYQVEVGISWRSVSMEGYY
jgi:hypothetical protein